MTTHVVSGGGNRLSSNRKGFTLAEVLVTLGIIGVVSAMTVPSLMQNYQRQSYVTQLHKVYNEMQQAFERYKSDNNAINLREAGMNDQTSVNNFVNTYFKVVNSCLDPNEIKPCFDNPENYRKISGESADAFDNNNEDEGTGMSFTLASGASIRPWKPNNRSDLTFIVAVVDVNGPKPPNIYGRDFFEMCIDVDGNIDGCFKSGGDAAMSLPLTTEQREDLFNSYCLGGGNSLVGCFGKILNDNWQMTY